MTQTPTTTIVSYCVLPLLSFRTIVGTKENASLQGPAAFRGRISLRFPARFKHEQKHVFSLFQRFKGKFESLIRKLIQSHCQPNH